VPLIFGSEAKQEKSKQTSFRPEAKKMIFRLLRIEAKLQNS
jgi:hypothetical protein